MAVFSKTITTSCIEYVHPWTESCSSATTCLGIHSLQESARIYMTVYMLGLIMRGKLPSKMDLQRTLVGISISSIFLCSNAFTFPLFACWLRKMLGHFNVLTVSFVPAFLGSYVSILLERPSRRGLLALYVTNVATETLFRMAAWRGLVRPIPHAQVIIFTISTAALLYFYRGRDTGRDTIFGLFRFIVSPYEEKDYHENILRSESIFQSSTAQGKSFGSRSRSVAYGLILSWCNLYRNLLKTVQGLSRHPTCPHPFSCAYYTLEGFMKLFAMGYGLQVCLRVLMQMRRLIRKPNLLPKLLIHRSAIQLGAFLGGFSGIFRFMSCILRRGFNRDSKFHAIPAGLMAGMTFGFFPDNTVALYVMWKCLQLIYSDSVQKGYLPEFPGATILLYSFSTAILFHAAVLEPHNLRPSYWKFLHNLSGGSYKVCKDLPRGLRCPQLIQILMLGSRSNYGIQGTWKMGRTRATTTSFFMILMLILILP